MPVKRRLAFYSTLRFHPWGAPDVLWSRAALKALTAGNAVLAVIRPHIADRPEISALRAAGAQIRLVPALSFGGKLQRLAGVARDLSSGASGTLGALERFAPDLLFINQGGFYDFLAERPLRALVARRKIPYVVLAHSNREQDAFSGTERAEAADFALGARRFLAISRFVLDLAERQLLVRLANGAVFQNPVDLPAALPLPWPQLTEPAFAVVSRLDAHGKGLDVLLGALARSPGRDAAWRLNVYGTGPDLAYLHDLAAWHGLAGRVTFHGHVADKAVIWRANQILLLPSRWEGCSYAMVEALLCGRPVLRTNYGGVSEWLRDGGFLCAAPETGLLAEALAVAWSQRAEWETMGRAAHAHARTVLQSDPEHILLDLLPPDAFPLL